MVNERRSIIISLTLVSALLLSPVSFQAQETRSDWSRLTSLESGSKVVVKLKNGKSMEGKLNNVSDSSLTVNARNSNQELRREDVLTVHHVTRKSATKATLIGAGVGAGTGAVLGAVGGRESDFDKLDQAVTAGLTIIGAGIGAIGGYLVGRSGRKRELIYEAR